MTYSEAVNYILDIPKFTKKNDAEHTKLFLQYLGDPQRSYKVIHVAGTNGKGSVCAYLDVMLRDEGKKTGLFTSPHLIAVNERIAVNGAPVSDDAFVRLFETALDAVRRMEAAGLLHPTFFEFLLGMALCAFRDADVDYAVLETGLGGRLDATSAVEPPEVCVITSIGYDHMQYLGDTLEEIAAEKAGIIRPGVPVFYAASSEESDSVIRKAAQNNGCFCKKIGKDAYEILGTGDKHIAFSCASDYYGNTTWKLNNIGKYQPGNAMLAMETMRWLTGEKGHPERWQKSLSELKWAGRMEEVLLFRPGGHGALIENLNDLDADVIFIKNIDNVVPDKLKGDTVLYKKVIAGVLVGLQQQAFAYLQLLDSGKYTHEQVLEILHFLQKKLYCKNPDVKNLEDAELVIYLKKKLNRPMRVCGMVKNVGEPGGGPFLAYNTDGTISLQILESSQIDMNDPAKKEMFEKGTHFNPVDLVCAVRDYKGHKFDLTKYVDKATGFISHKSKNGKELKALELPGLWNGAMSDWNTIFVEVPLSTFNPVKTVNDLLREQHQ